jgi:hypothetical protein
MNFGVGSISNWEEPDQRFYGSFPLLATVTSREPKAKVRPSATGAQFLRLHLQL